MGRSFCTITINGASGLKKKLTSKPTTPTTNNIHAKDKMWNNYNNDEHIA